MKRSSRVLGYLIPVICTVALSSAQAANSRHHASGQISEGLYGGIALGGGATYGSSIDTEGDDASLKRGISRGTGVLKNKFTGTGALRLGYQTLIGDMILAAELTAGYVMFAGFEGNMLIHNPAVEWIQSEGTNPLTLNSDGSYGYKHTAMSTDKGTDGRNLAYKPTYFKYNMKETFTVGLRLKPGAHIGGGVSLHGIIGADMLRLGNAVTGYDTASAKSSSFSKDLVTAAVQANPSATPAVAGSDASLTTPDATTTKDAIAAAAKAIGEPATKKLEDSSLFLWGVTYGAAINWNVDQWNIGLEYACTNWFSKDLKTDKVDTKQEINMMTHRIMLTASYIFW
jgi:hypothetical protein